ncbi:MAG: dihydrofolate reductase [Candidatus Micrarchaeota archaeon]|nr:dihydrofolate reductase [Candidatus Micrarchaeota archaeon]
MKVIIYMAPTPNGMIAKENYDESYVSAGNWRLFVSKVRQAGNVIIGRKTFEVALASGVFPIGGVLNVVMTSKKIENRWGGKVLFTSRSPREVIGLLKKKGYGMAIVAGGSLVNTSFLKQKLVDELHLDLQPEVFGKGTPLFVEESFDAKLRLLGTTKLSKNEVQVRYRVLKK